MERLCITRDRSSSKTMLYHFSVSGISICWDVPFEVNITNESVPFQQFTKPEHTDIYVWISPVTRLPRAPEEAVYEAGGYYTNGNVYYCDSPEGLPYAHVRIDPDGSVVQLTYVREYESRFTSSQIILNHLSMEALLLKKHVLLLHSSFIRLKNGCGILFSAPSGTGKSTQADLWKKYRGADIINGDRAGLRKVADRWTAWGLIYAGTSGIYRNESASIGSIVVLKQAKKNSLRRLRCSEAIYSLYPEVTVHRWEKGSVDCTMDLLIDLISSVPVFMLECRPDEEAVSVLERALKETL